MPVDHYENFPVASVLLPARLRRPVEAIYAFARSADDFADEGDISDSERLRLLDGYRAQLRQIEAGAPSAEPVFVRLAAAIDEFGLPVTLFHDLLDAFSQDVVKRRYADFPEVLDYCRRSANPIGRLLLHLYGMAQPPHLSHSDAICSALQLINFWQDVAIDFRKDRIYLPDEDLQRFGVREADIAAASDSEQWCSLMQFEVARARSLLESGRPLTRALPGRMGLELRFVMAGGNIVLDKIDAVRGDMFRRRPVVSKWDWLRPAPAALFA